MTWFARSYPRTSCIGPGPRPSSRSCLTPGIPRGSRGFSARWSMPPSASSARLRSRADSRRANKNAAAGRGVSFKRDRGVSGNVSCPDLSPLSKKLPAAADHRQVDIFRAAVIGRREADHKFAEVDVVHAFQRRDQLFAGQVLARASQALHYHLADDESLQARKIEIRVARLRHDLLVLLHDTDAARAPGEGHDL